MDDAFLSFFDFSSYSSNSFLWLMFATLPLLYRLCIEKFGLRTCPKTFLQCFALEHSITKVKNCRSVLGQVLRPNFSKQSPYFCLCIFDFLFFLWLSDGWMKWWISSSRKLMRKNPLQVITSANGIFEDIFFASIAAHIQKWKKGNKLILIWILLN